MEYPYEIILNKGGNQRIAASVISCADLSELAAQDGAYCIVQIWAILIDW